MGLFDRAKKWLGLPSEEDDDVAAPAQRRGGSDGARERLLAEVRARKGGERPPLKDDPGAAPGRAVEDALAAREAGDAQGARAILREIDRGSGLRTVLRAAAALEAGDRDELAELLPAISGGDDAWRVQLQTAGALADRGLAKALVRRARAAGAPSWAIHWSRAVSEDEVERREGLVELLVDDPALARTVAARDLAIEGAVADPDALSRWAGFAHGRDAIRRFGAPAVAALLDEIS